MRIIGCCMLVFGAAFIGIDCGSSATAKTLDAGYASTSWLGSGEIHDLGEAGQVINAIVKGVMVVRHSQGTDSRIVHTAQLECPIRVTLDKKDTQRTYLGLCTIFAHEGKDIGYAEWRCSGDAKECEGKFTFTGGAGGFNGASGTTPFFSRIIFEKLEGGNARAVGYAYWPNISVRLPE